MGKTSFRLPLRALRWTAWLAVGTLAGLVSGFVLALTRPRVLGAEEHVPSGAPDQG